MTIFDEELITRLCDIHLKTMWGELWKIHQRLATNTYMNNRNAQEFKIAPLHLAHRMNLVYSQLLKRGLYTRRKPLNPFQITDTPFTQIVREIKQYVPRYTKKAQLSYLNNLECGCREVN